MTSAKIFGFLDPLPPFSAFSRNLPYWLPLLCLLFRDPLPPLSADIINRSPLSSFVRRGKIPTTDATTEADPPLSLPLSLSDRGNGKVDAVALASPRPAGRGIGFVSRTVGAPRILDSVRA